MTNNNALIIPEGFSIETTDGATITLQPGQSVLDMLAHGGSGEPLWRVAVTQGHRDDRLPGHPDSFFLTRKVRKEAADGKPVREAEVIGPLGKTLQVWPIGIAVNRMMMPKYDPNNPDVEPLCRSENFVTPDARFAGKYAHQCAKVDARTGRLIASCPMAQWRDSGAGDSKRVPPPCGESYIVCVALTVDRGSGPEMLVAECYFKSSSATSGKSLVQDLRSFQVSGKPVYSHPIDLSIKAVGQGTTYTGLLRTDVKQEFSDEDMQGFLAAAQRWSDALKVRDERAKHIPETPAPVPGMPNTPPQTATNKTPDIVVSAQAAHNNNSGNGKKKALI